MDWSVELVANLALAMMVTALAATELRVLRQAAYAYLAMALLLVVILLVVAAMTRSEWLVVWAVVALVTKAGLISWLLFRYIKATDSRREAEPYVDFAPSVLLVLVIGIGVYRLTHAQAGLFAPGGAMIAEPYRTVLAVAAALFVLGLYTIVSKRDGIKTVIGLCLLENGVHLSLVSLAPAMPEMPIIGIVTAVFITVWMLLHVLMGVKREFGSIDTAQLRTLRE